MTDHTRIMLSGVLFVLALAWCFGVEVYRGCSRNHSAWLFWLHLSAPVVAIVLQLIGLWLLLRTERLWR